MMCVVMCDVCVLLFVLCDVLLICMWSGVEGCMFDYNLIIGMSCMMLNLLYVFGFFGGGFLFVLGVGDVFVDFVMIGEIVMLFDVFLIGCFFC